AAERQGGHGADRVRGGEGHRPGGHDHPRPGRAPAGVAREHGRLADPALHDPDPAGPAVGGDP
ncbi:MAG: hypothetical protein GWM90_24430, partial [Gemmatimonadetes bacterium]|nr:hypothetical protein [Gemmatimonadota bacterium]NIQ57910.1 hypothetical protein [Gemmatimonadota bacterium]NIU78079.1 hypothetical protein [Gammaproteobacteria bacterium]NIX47110.1 hypothetical protein [Gemmatimonadota bacterium]NIY11489.1 hypothetical protein [Gemmatimonadota bacterium]